MDGHSGGDFGGHHGGGFGGHHHGGNFGGHHHHHHHGKSGQDAGAAYLWLGQTYGRGIGRLDGLDRRSRASSRKWLLLVAALAAVALAIPLMH
ncbi:hypothetical protein [Kitasatospora sp. GAS204B]|uniref:hypothetical protein n=1 Tax=unclassified Kitasatospora TaxID=2633591 RepID=UPI0024765953|nr:hypothetical protein [Kitasatospora sp. GAS204B]MDH6116165.1 hypothetical protein [Kitasatospora sp. GAS204B]